MTLGLSISRIADNIYAQSALDAANKGIDVPAALTRAHARAIRSLIVEEATRIIGELGNAVLSTDIGSLDASADIITLDYDIEHHDSTVACLHSNMETAIVCGVLARASAAADINLAQWYKSLARLSARSLPGKIRRSC